MRIERPIDSVLVKSRKVALVLETFCNGEKFPKLMVFRALNISTRYSIPVLSVNLKDLEMDMSKLFNPGSCNVLRPTVRELGLPMP